jgi:hypothetical protein
MWFSKAKIQTVREFEVWAKRVERGTFLTQERSVIIDKIQAVSLDEANDMAQRLERGAYAVAVMGS